MKAMVLNQYGEQSAFELAEVAKPFAQPGQVIVRVAATSINTVDTMIRQMGKGLPLSLTCLLYSAWTSRERLKP